MASQVDEHKHEAKPEVVRVPAQPQVLLSFAGVNRIRFEGTLSARTPCGAEHP
jgi:hypothetical protein